MEKTLSSVSSDRRLVSLLQCGDELLHLVDPERVFSGAVVKKVLFGDTGADGSFRLRLYLGFPEGDSVCVSCLCVEEAVLVNSISVAVPGNRWESSSVEREKTVLRSLGALSGIGSRLRSLLSSVSPETAVPEDSFFCAGAKKMSSYRRILFEALFWEVEGASEESSARKLFKEAVVKFLRDEAGVCVKDEVCGTAELKEGRIDIRMTLDVFGLNGKSVMLFRNLGMGRVFEADCFIIRDRKKRPSLKVALDLNRLVPVLYTKSRSKNLNISVPRSGKGKG